MVPLCNCSRKGIYRGRLTSFSWWRDTGTIRTWHRQSQRKRELHFSGQRQCLVISASFWRVMVSDSSMNLQYSQMVPSSMACCFSHAVCLVTDLSSVCAHYHILYTYGWTHCLKPMKYQLPMLHWVQNQYKGGINKYNSYFIVIYKLSAVTSLLV